MQLNKIFLTCNIIEISQVTARLHSIANPNFSQTPSRLDIKQRYIPMAPIDR